MKLKNKRSNWKVNKVKWLAQETVLRVYKWTSISRNYRPQYVGYRKMKIKVMKLVINRKINWEPK